MTPANDDRMRSTPRRNGERGYALLASMLAGVVLASLGTAAVVYSLRDLEGVQQFRRAKHSMVAAESGALHALGTINQRMIKDFKAEVVDVWNSSPELLGSAGRGFDSESTSYSVEVESDPSDSKSLGTLLARARTSAGERTGVRVRVRRLFSFDWGAIYLAGSGTIAGRFDGDSFAVDGRNHLAFSDEPTSDGLEVPGIGVGNAAGAEALRAAASAMQSDNIQGLGPEPSILQSGGPQPAELGEIIAAMRDSGGYVTYTGTGGGNLSGDHTLGTLGSPQVSYLNNVRRVTGSIEGSGVLMVDGDLEITGNFLWIGWVLVNGTLTSGGNSTVQGAAWARNLGFSANGNMTASFCIECLQLATSATTLDRLPSKVSVVAWEEMPWEDL